jgi:hypothetical protein
MTAGPMDRALKFLKSTSVSGGGVGEGVGVAEGDAVGDVVGDVAISGDGRGVS